MHSEMTAFDRLMHSLNEGDLVMVFYNGEVFQIPILSVGAYRQVRCYIIGAFDFSGSGEPSWEADPHVWVWDEESSSLVAACTSCGVCGFPAGAEISVEREVARGYVGMYEKALAKAYGICVSH